MFALLVAVGALHKPTCTVAARCGPSWHASPRSIVAMQSAASPAESAPSSERLLKLSLFAGVTYSSLASGASVGKVMGLKVVAGSLAATLPGVFDSPQADFAVTWRPFGYGLAMMWMGGLFLPACKGSPSFLLAFAYMLYGLKVVLFQRARNARPDYIEKALAPTRAKQPPSTSLPARLSVVIFIGLLLATFSFPLHAASYVTATGLPSEWGRRAWGVLYGTGAALFSLLIQTVADVQKFKHKAREGADAPCLGGLWSLTRHPNYLGEIGFQLGVLGAGLSGCTSIASGWLSLLAPVTSISIMLAATRRLEAQQKEAYGGQPEYAAYLRSTQRLLVDWKQVTVATFLWIFPGGWGRNSTK